MENHNFFANRRNGITTIPVTTYANKGIGHIGTPMFWKKIAKFWAYYKIRKLGWKLSWSQKLECQIARGQYKLFLSRRLHISKLECFVDFIRILWGAEQILPMPQLKEANNWCWSSNSIEWWWELLCQNIWVSVCRDSLLMYYVYESVKTILFHSFKF